MSRQPGLLDVGMVRCGPGARYDVLLCRRSGGGTSEPDEVLPGVGGRPAVACLRQNLSEASARCELTDLRRLLDEVLAKTQRILREALAEPGPKGPR